MREQKFSRVFVWKASTAIQVNQRLPFLPEMVVMGLSLDAPLEYQDVSESSAGMQRFLIRMFGSLQHNSETTKREVVISMKALSD